MILIKVVLIIIMIVKTPKQLLQSQSQAQANYHFQPTMNKWDSWSNNLPVFTNQ